MKFVCQVSLALWAATAGTSTAQITVPPGFSVTVYPIGAQVTGIDIAPPGPYAERLYVSVSGRILTVDTLTGAATTFATGLATGGGAPSGIEFDEGTFGTGLLYVAQNNGTVVTVDSSGAVASFASGGGLFSCNDITFAHAGSALGSAAFVGNGVFTGGTISRVDASAAVTPFTSGLPLRTALGLAVPPAGSPFGDALYVADTSTGAIHRVDASGTLTPFVTGLPGPADVTFARGGLFGELMYVSDLISDEIYTIDRLGNVTSFATGIGIHNSGWNGDVHFDSFGEALYVASNTELVRIGDTPDIPFCHGNGASVPCPCGNTAPLSARSGCLNSTGLGGRLETLGSRSVSANDLAFTASQMPSSTYCILFAGTDLVPETPIGDGIRCVGGNAIRLGVRQANPAGVASWGPSMNSMLGWMPGDVLRFQIWYRDAFVGPCGTHFNVTNGVQLTATP